MDVDGRASGLRSTRTQCRRHCSKHFRCIFCYSLRRLSTRTLVDNGLLWQGVPELPKLSNPKNQGTYVWPISAAAPTIVQSYPPLILAPAE